GELGAGPAKHLATSKELEIVLEPRDREAGIARAALSDGESALHEIHGLVVVLHRFAEIRQFLDEIGDVGMLRAPLAAEQRQSALEIRTRLSVLVNRPAGASDDGAVAARLVVRATEIQERRDQRGIIAGEAGSGQLKLAACSCNGLGRPPAPK